MELDDFKHQLKAKLETVDNSASETTLKKALQGNTQSILGKLQKSLLFEIVFGFIFLAAFIYVAVTSPWWSIRVYFNIFNVLMVVFIILLMALWRKVKTVSAASEPVKNNLESVLKVLREFVKRYFQFTMGLIPVCFGLSFWLGYQNGVEAVNTNTALPELLHFSNANQVILFFVIYALVLTVGIYFFTKWYLKKLYGKYLDELELLIKELENN